MTAEAWLLSEILQRKSISIGILMAAIFLAIDAVVPFYVGYETMIPAFAICLLVVCSALIDTPKEGLICGLIVLAAQNAGAFVEVALMDGSAIAAATVPYLLIWTSSYSMVGLIGGYLGGRLAGGRKKVTKPPVSRR
jgi:hypothetical protein